MDTEKEIVREIPKGLLKWYDFRKNSRALYVDRGRRTGGNVPGNACGDGLCVFAADDGQRLAGMP